jgi:hypothetical protein
MRWAHALGNRLDGATLACAVASFEDNADFAPRLNDPLLELDQFNVQPEQLFPVLLIRQGLVFQGPVVLCLGLRHSMSPCAR